MSRTYTDPLVLSSLIPLENEKTLYAAFLMNNEALDSIQKSLGIFWLFIVGLFFFVCIFYYLYVDSLTYAFG
jgi:hypothetical protein